MLEDAISLRLCTRIGCSTCATTDFRERVFKAALVNSVKPDSDVVAPFRISPAIAVTLAHRLAELRPRAELAYEFDEAARFLLYELWRFRALEAVEAVLDGTWAGSVLDRMRAHHAALTEQRQEATDPARIEERRETKRRAKQEQHAERLKRQAEKARLWHLAHDDDPTAR